MANKAALIAKTLDLGLYEPALTRVAMLGRVAGAYRRWLGCGQ